MQKQIKKNYKNSYWQFLYTFCIFHGTYKLKFYVKKGLEFLYFGGLFDYRIYNTLSFCKRFWLYKLLNANRLYFYVYYEPFWKGLKTYLKKTELNFFKQSAVLKKMNLFNSKYTNDRRRRWRKRRYLISIKRTKNNFFFTLITFITGNVICKTSAGCCEIKTKKLKKARDTVKIICENFAKLCLKKNIKSIRGFYINQIKLSLFLRLKTIIRSIFWKQRIRIKTNLWLFNKKPHNGLRLKKLRRL